MISSPGNGEKAKYDVGHIFNKYIHQIQLAYNTINDLKSDLYSAPINAITIYEQGIQGGSGAYDTNALNDATLGSGNEKGKGPTHKKTTLPGGKFVEIKDKCSKYPYCNQGPDAIAESISKKTGRTLEEVKQIITNFKQK